MKEYRILFDYRPGTDKQMPEHIFVELEDETGKSTGAGAWEGHPQREVKKGNLVYLVLPNYEEEHAKLLALARQFMTITNRKHMLNSHGFLEPRHVTEHRRLTEKLLNDIRKSA